MAEDEKYPVWCAEPNCGIDDCGDCPFSPWNLRQKQKDLEKKVDEFDNVGVNLNNETIFLREEISELEKKIDHKDARVIITDADKQVIWVEGFMDRLEKLELLIHNSPPNSVIKPEYHTIKKELLELKERIEYLYKGLEKILPRLFKLEKKVDAHEHQTNFNIYRDSHIKTHSKLRARVDELKEFRHHVAMPRIIEIEKRVEGIFMSIHGISDGEKYYGSGPLGGSVPRNIQPDSTPSKCKFYNTKTDICNNEMWKFSDEPQSCVLWGQKGCSKFEPKEPPLQEPFDLRKFIEFALENAKVELPNKEQISEYILVEKADIRKLGTLDLSVFDFIKKYLSEEDEKE